MSDVYLDRQEIRKLYDIMNKYNHVERFEIKQEKSSGIGIGTSIRFVLEEIEGVQVTRMDIDITDYLKW